jgi:hypothetical protein
VRLRGDGRATALDAPPGPYAVVLNGLYECKSALLWGVGEDAEHVVSHLVRS